MVLGLAILILGPILAFSVASVAHPAVAVTAPTGARTVALTHGVAPHVVSELREPQTDAPSATPAPARTPVPTARPTAVPRRVPAIPTGAGPAASPTSVIGIIEAAAARWGVSGSWMVGIARCESGLRTNAVNPSGPYDGLFQFLMSTFRANGGTNIWSATDQANIAAKMLAHGQAHQWSCA